MNILEEALEKIRNNEKLQSKDAFFMHPLWCKIAQHKVKSCDKNCDKCFEDCYGYRRS